MIVNDDGKITPTTTFDFLRFSHTGFYFHKMEEHLKFLASNVKARSSQIFQKLGTKRATRSKSHNGEPQISGTTVQYLAVCRTRRLVF
jgi:hypothetical protein